MKTRTSVFALLLTIAAACACTREAFDPFVETSPIAGENSSSILVPFTTEAGTPETRVGMNGSTSNIVFSEGDQLMVYNSLMAEPAILTMASGAGQRTAVFTGNLVLKSGKTEADLVGKTIVAILIPKTGVDEGVFSYDSSTKKLTVDYSSKSLDSDLEALVNRTILYRGETRYEDKRFTFEMMTSYVKMNVTVPSEESDLARDYTVTVQPNIMISNKCVNSGGSWSYADYCAGEMTGTFTASSATSGTLYMALLAHRDVRLEIDDYTYDEPTFDISMENAYKEYGLLGGSIRGQVILPGKGYTKSITLTDPSNEDVLLGQPASVHDVFLTAAIDRNGNHMVSKYEAAQTVSPTRLSGNANLTDATFLKYFTGLSSVPYQYFTNCSNLSRVSLPKHITAIDKQAFEGCSALKNIIIPATVETIKDNAFGGCTSLSSVYFTAPSVVESICSMAFQGCTSLPGITIPASVETLSAHAFDGCSSLLEVNFETSSKLATLGTAVFQNCTALDVISLPSGVTAIPDKAFMGCSALEKIKMGTRVESVGNYAFDGCVSLPSIVLPATSVTSIGRHAFSGCVSLKAFSLPSRLKTVDEYTFYGCTSLESVIIPFNVQTIGAGAFRGCHLTEVTLPGSITFIGEYAFAYCSYLTTVYANAETPPETGNGIFYKHNDNLVIYVPSVTAQRAYKNAIEWRNYNIQVPK